MSMSGKSPGPDTLAKRLRRRGAGRKTMGFDEFMASALYDSQGGYYAAEKSRTGRQGDFLTSVSVGPVFGRLLAAQFAQMWRALGEPEDFTLVEQGANDGQLMEDILAACERDAAGWRPAAVIVEPLSTRRAAQEQTLRPRLAQVRWVSREGDLPAFTGAFFANELLDAFPVKLLTRLDGVWMERRVGHDGTNFVFIEEPIADANLLAIAQALPIPENIIRFDTEWCPSLSGWMHAVAKKLQRGWMFLADYGHPAFARFHPARSGGSLAARSNHEHRDNPLDAPGTQDLTAHVDFTAVARAGAEAGLQPAGFTDQHHALAALAAEVFPPMATTPLDSAALAEMRSLRLLLHPESMGTSFKFLALSKNAPHPLSAFRFARNAQTELFGS